MAAEQQAAGRQETAQKRTYQATGAATSTSAMLAVVVFEGLLALDAVQREDVRRLLGVSVAATRTMPTCGGTDSAQVPSDAQVGTGGAS